MHEDGEKEITVSVSEHRELCDLRRQCKALKRAMAEEEHERQRASRVEREQAEQTKRDKWAAEYRMQRDALLQSRFTNWQEMLARLTAGEFKTRKALGAAYGMSQRMTAYFIRLLVDAGRMSQGQLETCFVRSPTKKITHSVITHTTQRERE